MPRQRSGSRDRTRDRRHERRYRSRSGSRERQAKKLREKEDKKSVKVQNSQAGERSCATTEKAVGPEEKKRCREICGSKSAGQEDEESVKRRRLEAWKLKQDAQNTFKPKKESAENQLGTAWVPWDDSTPAVDLAHPPVPDVVQRKRNEAALRDIEMMATGAKDAEVDPLDAFMASEVIPEVQAKEEEEKKRAEADMVERMKVVADGRKPKRAPVLDDSDSEEEADLELKIPMNKVKLVIGANGTKIQEIQKKSKCRIQVKKDDTEMNRAFGSGPHIPVSADGKQKMVTIMLFGDARGVEFAEQLINEAVENRDQKQKQRHKEYEKKREAKIRERQIYHLRHARDYDALGLPLGASKADVKAAYRKLAVKWHPDKHLDDQEAAKAKFQAIQAAYQSLMMSNEDEKVEQLGT